MSMPPPSLLLGDEYKDIMQSEHRDDQWQNGGITANDLEAWKWEDRHGYNNENSNEAIQLFAERGLICITETNTSFESVGIGRRKEKWTIKKYVTVQSLDMHEVPIQATEDTRENAERQCNLMILGELYRCEIIGPVEDELLQYLPTDIQSTISTDTANTNKFELPAITTDTANTEKFESPAITTDTANTDKFESPAIITTANTNKFELPAITTTTVNMNKFELPNQVLTSFPNQVRTSFSNQVLTSLPNTPTSGATGSASIPAGFSQQPTANVNTSTTFLGNIGTGQGQNRMGGGGGRGPGPNARERDEYDRFRFHPDLQRRKFAVQKKTMDEAIEEQCQVNTGPVRQANIAVKVEGGGNNGVNVEQIKIKSFNDLALTPQLKTTLNDINYFEPTNLQKYVIPLIQHTGNDILCLAATGSGKSGAFLIPLVHRLQGLRYTPRGELKSVNKTAPLAIVVAHTKELVQQLYDNAYIFANQTQVGVAIARGQMSNQDLRGYLTAGCDILVTTPGKLSQFLAENWIQLNCVQFVIIDEVDKFVNDDQMVNVLYKLREKLHQTKNATYRFLMFSATFNISAENKIVDLLRPNYYAVVTQNVNQTVAHVHQKICLVDSKNWGRNPRLQMLKNLLQRLSTRIEPQQEHFCFETPKTIVFVNEGRTSDRLAVALSYWGFKAMSVNGRRSMEQRTKAVKEFKRGKWPILVATDVISRGINLPNVKFVIVYEMPPYERCEQYIHRIGRVGRVGTDDGHAFVFFDPELPNEEMLAEFLYKQLRHSKQPIPKFLEKMLAEKLQLEQMLKQNQQQPRMRSSPIGHQNNNNNSSEVQPTWNNGGGW